MLFTRMAKEMQADVELLLVSDSQHNCAMYLNFLQTRINLNIINKVTFNVAAVSGVVLLS